MSRVRSIAPTSSAQTNALLSGSAWSGQISYGFVVELPRGSGATTEGTAKASASLQAAVHDALADIRSFTSININHVSGNADPDLRILEAERVWLETGGTQVAIELGAYAFLPSGNGLAGASFYGGEVTADLSAGSYGYRTVLHEIGHALGLKHPNEAGLAAPVSASIDTQEFSVMSNRSAPGLSLADGLGTERGGYAQTYMPADIAALQHMYGADFSQKHNTKYVFDPTERAMLKTIWDGGGTDTYDFSRYRNDLQIDLTPGGHSTTGQEPQLNRAQELSRGDDPVYADGAIHNAHLYRGDKRSLIEKAIGGTGDDRITGNAANNTLVGNAGRDTLSGDVGDDTLLGGKGNDGLDGGKGDDKLAGQAGADRLSGGHGADTLTGSHGADTLDGGQGRDLLVGGVDGDKLKGEGGDDTIYGGQGRDALIGGSGDDWLDGGASADRLMGGWGNDELFGGGGNDTLDGGNRGDFIAGGDGNDDAAGAGGNDKVRGGDGNDRLKGQSGDDKLFGDAGHDLLDGGKGKDTLFGGAGRDTIDGSGGDDRGDGGAGVDLLFGGSGRDSLFGGQQEDTILGEDGADWLEGGAHDDSLVGGRGSDALFGGNGDDTLVATSGRDTLTGGAGEDVFVVAAGTAITDFQDGDLIDVDDPAAVYAGAIQVGGDVELTLEGSDGVVRLIGVNVSQLISDDFV